MYCFNEIPFRKIQYSTRDLTYFNSKKAAFIEPPFYLRLLHFYAIAMSLGSFGLASSFLGKSNFKIPSA